MTDEEMAEEYLQSIEGDDCVIITDREERKQAFLAGLKAGRPQWHKIFVNSEPYNYEYYECPQETLPKKQGFYFVRLKNGFVKICELKSDILFGRKKIFYNLHGGTQSNVAEWLEYPTV